MQIRFTRESLSKAHSGTKSVLGSRSEASTFSFAGFRCFVFSRGKSDQRVQTIMHHVIKSKSCEWGFHCEVFLNEVFEATVEREENKIIVPSPFTLRMKKSRSDSGRDSFIVFQIARPRRGGQRRKNPQAAWTLLPNGEIQRRPKVPTLIYQGHELQIDTWSPRVDSIIT